MLRIIDTQKMSAKENMDYDEIVLKNLLQKPFPTLHFYDWERPSFTFGYFIDIKKYFRLDSEFDCSRRPTGGGVVFHTSDLAFSFFLPENDPHFSQESATNYRFVNAIVLDALQDFLKIECLELALNTNEEAPREFCMGRTTRYDISLCKKKVVGAAQRKVKGGYLHQGSIFLAPLDKAFWGRFLLSPLPDDSLSLFPYTTNLYQKKRELKSYLIKYFIDELH